MVRHLLRSVTANTIQPHGFTLRLLTWRYLSVRHLRLPLHISWAKEEQNLALAFASRRHDDAVDKQSRGGSCGGGSNPAQRRSFSTGFVPLSKAASG